MIAFLPRINFLTPLFPTHLGAKLSQEYVLCMIININLLPPPLISVSLPSMHMPAAIYREGNHLLLFATVCCYRIFIGSCRLSSSSFRRQQQQQKCAHMEMICLWMERERFVRWTKTNSIHLNIWPNFQLQLLWPRGDGFVLQKDDSAKES
jgi:hypothetical protein